MIIRGLLTAIGWLNGHRIAAWLLLSWLLLGGGILYSVYLGEKLLYPDETEYYQIAHSLLEHRLFSFDGREPTAFRPPVYPFFLAVAQAVHDSFHLARALNYLLLLLALVLLHRLLTYFYAAAAGWLAAGLVFAYPVLFYTAGTLYPQTLALFLIVAVSYLLLLGGERRLKTLLLGLLLGLLALLTPTCLFMIPVTLLAAPLLAGWRWRSALVMGLCAALVIGGWTLRNAWVLGEPVVISSNIQVNLTLANQNPTGNDAADSDGNAGGGSPASDSAQASNFITLIANTVAALLRNPGEYLWRVADFFDYAEWRYVSSEQSLLKDIVMFITYHTLLALAGLRLLLAFRYRLTALDVWVLTLYVAAALFQALAFARIRYRLPVDFMLIAMAASALYLLLDRIVQSRASSGAIQRSPVRYRG